MEDISLAGLLGAIAGTAVAAAIFVPLVDGIERGLRLRRAPAPGEQATSAPDLALLRRGVLALDILVCAGVGYWLGQMIGG
jgi:hypothetical protein